MHAEVHKEKRQNKKATETTELHQVNYALLISFSEFNFTFYSGKVDKIRINLGIQLLCM